jgi:hypothetical protein
VQAVPDGARLFELALQPEGLHQPWHAWLRDAEGHTHEFDAPIELLRHLLRLNDHNPPAGGLR